MTCRCDLRTGRESRASRENEGGWHARNGAQRSDGRGPQGVRFQENGMATPLRGHGTPAPAFILQVVAPANGGSCDYGVALPGGMCGHRRSHCWTGTRRQPQPASNGGCWRESPELDRHRSWTVTGASGAWRQSADANATVIRRESEGQNLAATGTESGNPPQEEPVCRPVSPLLCPVRPEGTTTCEARRRRRRQSSARRIRPWPTSAWSRS